MMKTILVVDNDPKVRKFLPALLEEYDYSVISSGNAQEALAQIQAKPIDVVLTDIRIIPQDSGLTLLKKIQNINQDLPVILMTAYTDADIVIEAIVNGAFDFITKPFNTDYLLNRINRALKYHDLIKLRKNYGRLLEQTVAERTRGLEEALSTLDIMSREIVNRLDKIKKYSIYEY